MPRPVSLREQLLWRLLIPLLAVSLLGLASAYLLAERFSVLVFDRELAEALVELSQEALEAVGADPPRGIESEAGILSAHRPELRYDVIDRAGTVLAGNAALPPPPKPAPGQAMDDGVRLYDAVVAGEPLRVASLRAVPSGGQDKFLRVQVAEARHDRDRLAREMLVAAIPYELLSAFFLLLAVMYGVRRGIKPLNDLGQVIAARSVRDLRPLDADAAPLEARYLVASINDLMGRVMAAADAQQRCVADAAHLMQTPLAGMKAQIELGRRLDVSEEARRVWDHLHTEITRLSHTARDMLMLARNDPTVLTSLQLVPTDLHRLVRDATGDWVPVALQRGIDLGCTSCSEGAMIQGDAARLRDLLDSLLDNAIRYTQPGGEVTVGFSPDDPTTLRVLDNGPGIPPEERERVFDRFYRVLGNGAEGSGLGLAIVKEVAELHGATVELRDGPGDVGTEVRVAFPHASGAAVVGAPVEPGQA